MKRIRILWVLHLGMLISFGAFGQEVLTMEKYLGTALRDQSLESFQAQLNFLETNKYNSPWLNRVEFRLGSEDANISMNEYRLRISPSNPAEVKANKIYHHKHVKNLGTQYKVALNLALKNRYQMLIDFKFLQQALEINERHLVIVNELAKNMTQLGMENINAGVIINTQSDQTELMLRVESLKSQKGEINYYMGLDLPGSDLNTWRDQNWISVDEIKLYLDNREKEEEWTSLYVLEAEEDVQMKEQMLKIEKAESRSNIGYIQGNFDSERGNELNEHFGFQVGVRLPLVNPDKPDLNRERVKMIEEQKDLEATKSFVNQKKDMTVIQINHLIGQYRMIKNRLDLSQNIGLQSAGEINLSDVSKLKKYQFGMQKVQLSLEKEIRELFIDYLDIKGLLVQGPIINYLSSNFTPIN